ncbi:MAG: uracil-DNA glycosylase family protein [Bacteroidota bacterium]
MNQRSYLQSTALFRNTGLDIYTMKFCDAALSYYANLHFNRPLPAGMAVMNPYHDPGTFGLCTKFFHKFYPDSRPRKVLLGINPGRFGSGTTGISFTDPIRLAVNCGIENALVKKPELSSDFIYQMIDLCGGPQVFYQHYFVTAVSPLGFLKDGKNINYYDDPGLTRAALPFIVESMEGLIKLPIYRDLCFCIGEGKNYDFLFKMNEQHQWFGEIKALPHPRFIMQYKRKQLERYLLVYKAALGF